MRRPILYALLCASVSMPVMAQAQDASDVLVMRRAVADPKGKTTIQPSADYDRVPLTLRDSGKNHYAVNGMIGLEVETVGCLLTSGAVNADQTLCVDGAGPRPGDIINFNAKMDPDLKTYYVARAQYEEVLPTYDSGEIDALCSGTVSIAGAVYQGSCDPSSVVNTYAKYASSLVDPITMQLSQNTAAADRLNFAIASVGCMSTQTGGIVANSNCNGITKSPNSGETFNLPATYVPQLREVYLNASDIAGIVPPPDAILARTPASLCASGVTIRVDGQNWKIGCGTPDDPSKYSRVIEVLNDPVNFGANNTPNDTSTNQLKLVVGNTTCRDSTGKTVTGKCDYLQTGPSIYDIVTVPATYVPDLREIYVNGSDIQAATGQQTPILKNRYLADACTGAYVTMVVKHNGVTHSNWKFICGTPDDPSKYILKAQTLRDPRDYGPNRNINMDPNATRLGLTVGSTICYNSSTKATADPAKCYYLSNGIKMDDVLWMPAVFDSVAKTVKIDINAFRALGHDTNFDYNHNTIMCGRNLTVDVNYVNYRLICG